MATEEKNVLIAKRVPPGDRWALIDEPTVVQNSLTETLEAYFQKVSIKPQAFRLEPLKGELYMITTEDVAPPPPKKFNLYGDY